MACSVVKTLGRKHSALAQTLIVMRNVVPPMLQCVKEKNMPVKMSAERACFLVLGVDSGDSDANVTELEAALRQSKVRNYLSAY